MKYLLALLTLTLLAACAPKSIDDYHTAENEEEIMRLLNNREYAKAVWLLESKHGKNPKDKNVSFLLGQAYLGKAGFEPLSIAAKVSDTQTISTAESRELFPQCPDDPLGDKPKVGCVLKRVYLHTPDADLHDLTRARELFRFAYPSASESPDWINVQIGVIEAASCIKRAGNIFLFAKHITDRKADPTDAELRWLIQQTRRAIRETGEALKRAEHSGKKITQFLTGNSEMTWFRQAKEGVEWVEEAGLKALFDTLRDTFLVPGEEGKYKETLDRIRRLLDEQEKLTRPE